MCHIKESTYHLEEFTYYLKEYTSLFFINDINFRKKIEKNKKKHVRLTNKKMLGTK